MEHILSLTIFSPLIGIVLIMLVPRRFEEGSRAIALFTSLFTFALTCYLWTNFGQTKLFYYEENLPWISALNINYHVGVDGVSLFLNILTALLVPICVAASWEEIKTQRKGFYIFLLACEVGLLGAFSAMDLFLFYIFWEVMLIPMYFLIGIWGSGRRIYVALKFLLFTMTGSVLMLVGLVYLYVKNGQTFDILAISANPIADPNVQLWLFLAFALAFAIKVPMFPFHTWLPDAHTEAPTAGSVLLAGVFLKAGTYGFYRIAMPFFPSAVAELRTYIFVLAVIGIVYGAAVSVVQKDLKRLIAYSSVSHLGFVILGLIALNPEGVQGAVLQMVNHGLSTGALFLLFGMLYSRYHTRNIADYGGIASVMPFYTGVFIFVGISSLGLPGLNNFVGELLIFLGTFRVNYLYAIISATAIILAAIYILWAIERVFFGKVAQKEHAKDMGLREFALVVPLLVGILWLGVHPSTILSKIKYSTAEFRKYAKRSIVEPARDPLQIMIPERLKLRPDIIIPEGAVGDEAPAVDTDDDDKKDEGYENKLENDVGKSVDDEESSTELGIEKSNIPVEVPPDNRE